jgi:hypothetical protein
VSKLRETLAELQEDLPLNRPVKLRVIPMRACGSCSLSDSERFITICIRAGDPASVQEDTLIHEYAHAMEFDIRGNHTKFWGECHSKVFTAWTKRHA